VILELGPDGAELAMSFSPILKVKFDQFRRGLAQKAQPAAAHIALARPGQRLYGADLIRARGLRAVLAEDFAAHYRSVFAPGFQAVAVYRFGTWVETINAKPLKILPKLVHRLAYLFVRNVYGIELEASVRIGRRFVIGHQSGIVIHKYATFGDDCLVRQNVTLGEGADGMVAGIGPVIGDRVSFGPGAVVLGNVTIGDNVIIGPNCVVTTSIPAGRTVFNPPPRQLPREAPTAAVAE